jgi:Holliday junction DNA helicase RuvB
MAAMAAEQRVADYLVLEEGLPFPEVERRIRLAHADAGLQNRALAFYLDEVSARGLHQLAGCRTAVQYAVSRFGMGQRAARDLIALGGFLRAHGRIDAAFAAGELSWSKVRELARVVVPEHEARWLERALELHVDELALEVKLRNPGDAPRRPDDRKGLPDVRIRIDVKVPPDVYAKYQRSRRKVEDESGRALREGEFFDSLFDLALTTSPEGAAPGRIARFDSPYSVNVSAGPGAASVDTEDGPVPLDDVTAAMAACDAGCVDPSRCDEEADRRVPPSLRRRLYSRDGGRCRACNCPHRKQAHHIVPVSKGGPTRLDNLMTLCRACHSLVHAGLLVVTGDSDSGWRFLNDEGRDVHGVPDVTPAEAIGELAAEGTRLSVQACESGKFGTACQTSQVNTVEEEVPPVPRLADLVGQPDVIDSLGTAVAAARKRDEPLGHTLLAGPPGLGRTTLARAVAAELGARVHSATGTLLQNASGLVRLLNGLGRRDILFIDEIHAMGTPVAEVLYEALTERRVSVVVESETGAHSEVLPLPPFTLIGATTDESALPEAFLSRFEHVERLEFYHADDLADVVRRAAAKHAVAIDDDAAAALAEVARGTPREALRLLKRARDHALIGGLEVIDAGIAAATLRRLGIDRRGPGPVDRAYLGVLRERGPERPIGLARIAAILGRPARVPERLHEPCLFRLGLATTTPNGRVATTA